MSHPTGRKTRRQWRAIPVNDSKLASQGNSHYKCQLKSGSIDGPYLQFTMPSYGNQDAVFPPYLSASSSACVQAKFINIRIPNFPWSPRHYPLHIPQTFPIIQHLLLLLLLLPSETYQPTLASSTFPVQFPSYPFQVDLRFRRLSPSIPSPATLLDDQNNPVSASNQTPPPPPSPLSSLLFSSLKPSFPAASADSQSSSPSSSSVLTPPTSSPFSVLLLLLRRRISPHRHPKLNHT